MRYMRALPFLLVLLIVLFAGLKPDPVPQMFHHQDKLHHLAGFAALVFTLRFAFMRLHWGVVVIGSLAAALAIELLQGALPYRTPSLGDMLANGLGVGCGLLASLMLRSWLARVEGRLVAPSGA
ncbi:hypothetical protein AUR59_004470 [Stutzerimonas balearica]|uniref:VanZ family protein n=1 Tax=Stutzerimonas balearica TaxID=74829 RepID=UPI000774C4A2|nr:VanZ family protein [Stutzerimonas balearica]OMG68420.1 hypothetical protein AUR59_004470 [Stutzerimonas balearica]WIX01643.1 VanZ family protein [Pseudomonas sp. AR5]